MQKILFTLLFVAAYQAADAQTSAVTALEWEPNPTTVMGSATTAAATVGGNVFYQQRNALATTRYENHDTTWMLAYYNPDFDMVARNMHHDRPGNFTFAGLVADTAGFAAMLARIDSSDGTLRWAKKYNAGIGGNFFGTMETAMGSLAYGQWFDFLGSKGFLANLDQNGDTIWTGSYTAGDAVEFNAAHRLGSGYLLVGRYLAPSAGGDHVMLMRIDGNGDPIWAKHYVSGRSEWVEESKMDADGNLYLAVSSDDTTQLAGAMRLMSTDSAGNFRFGTSLTMDVYNESFSILHWPGEGIFLTGTTSDGTTGPGVVARFDLQGQFQWAKSYLPGGYAEPQSIARFGDHGLLVAIVDENNSNGVTLIEMDSSGSMQSPCNFTVESPVVNSYTPIAVPLTVARTRGCTIDNLVLSQVAPTVLTQQICLAIGAPEPLTRALTIYPQPMTEQAEIVIPDGYAQEEIAVEVFDVNGRMVQASTSKTANGIRLERNHLPAGMYTCRVRAGEMLIGVVRVVMQ